MRENNNEALGGGLIFYFTFYLFFGGEVRSAYAPNAPPAYTGLPSFDRCTPLQRVCCCGPGGQEISIDSGGRRAPQQHSSTAFKDKCEQCHVVS